MSETKTWLALICFFVLAVAGARLVGAGVRTPAVPARGQGTLRVMTYNIHVGVGMDKKLDLARIAGVINRERPDLVGLQEVDRGVERTGRVDQIAELARLTKMEYAFAHNLDYQGGQYGVAVLSRFPILATEHRRFASLRETERRGFIRIEVRAGGRRINFATTHLDYRFDDGRAYEAGQLLKALGQTLPPLVVVGDFNDEPAGRAHTMMLERFADAWRESRGDEAGYTFPAHRPVKRIDYIFCSREGGLRVRRAWIVDTQASDHLPLVADLELAQ
jgi:endonuclease/exonuclease/phosphatase family metal-dependent hydrolase